MRDINGQPLNPGDIAQLMCEVTSVDPREGVRVRILNSEMELVVGCKHDEALGGCIADSELVRFVEIEPREAERRFTKEEIVPLFSIPAVPVTETKTNAVAGDPVRRGVS